MIHKIFLFSEFHHMVKKAVQIMKSIYVLYSIL